MDGWKQYANQLDARLVAAPSLGHLDAPASVFLSPAAPAAAGGLPAATATLGQQPLLPSLRGMAAAGCRRSALLPAGAALRRERQLGTK